MDQRKTTQAVEQEEPTRPTPEQTNQPTKKRRFSASNPGVIVILSLLLIGLGAAAGVLGYKYWFEKPAPASSVDTPAVTQKPALTAKQLITEVTPKLTGTSPDTGGVNAPAVKPAGYEFYVQPGVDDKSTPKVARVVSASQSDIDVAAAGKVLTDHGLTAKKMSVSDNAAHTYTRYTNNEVACAIENAVGSDESEPRVVSVACSDMTTYRAIAKEAKPMITAALTAGDNRPTEVDLLVQDKPTIKQSATQGYQIANIPLTGYDEHHVQVGGYLGLFYQTPDKKWHYLTGTQNDVPCSLIDTPDRKKAYLGEPCSDTTSGAITTVKL